MTSIDDQIAKAKLGHQQGLVFSTARAGAEVGIMAHGLARCPTPGCESQDMTFVVRRVESILYAEDGARPAPAG